MYKYQMCPEWQTNVYMIGSVARRCTFSQYCLIVEACTANIVIKLTMYLYSKMRCGIKHFYDYDILIHRTTKAHVHNLYSVYSEGTRFICDATKKA